MWLRLFEIMSEEIDNIFYFCLAVVLILIALWFKPEGEIMAMVTALFGALLIKVKGGDTVSKIAGAIKDVAVTQAGQTTIGKVAGAVKDLVK